MNKLSSFRPKDFLFRLLHPTSWYNQVETSERVDEFVNSLIDEDRLVSVPKPGEHTASFKSKSGKIVQIWTSNFPYAYGTVYRVDGEMFTYRNQGPFFITRYKLANYLANKVYQQGLKEFNKLIDKE